MKCKCSIFKFTKVSNYIYTFCGYREVNRYPEKMSSVLRNLLGHASRWFWQISWRQVEDSEIELVSWGYKATVRTCVHRLLGSESASKHPNVFAQDFDLVDGVAGWMPWKYISTLKRKNWRGDQEFLSGHQCVKFWICLWWNKVQCSYSVKLSLGSQQTFRNSQDRRHVL